jgi:hypothetical protein
VKLPSWRMAFWGLMILGALRLGLGIIRELVTPGPLSGPWTRALLAFIGSHTGWRPPAGLAVAFWIGVLALLAVLAIMAGLRIIKPRWPGILSGNGGRSGGGDAGVTPLFGGARASMPGGVRGSVLGGVLDDVLAGARAGVPSLPAAMGRAYDKLAKLCTITPVLTINRMVIGGIGLIGCYVGFLYSIELSLVLAGRAQLYQSRYAFLKFDLTAPPPLTALWRLWYLHIPSITICGWLVGGLLLLGVIVRFASSMSHGLTGFTLGRTALGWAMLLFVAHWALVNAFPGVMLFAALLAGLVMIAIIWGVANFPVTGIVTAALIVLYFAGFMLFDYVLVWIFEGLAYANLIYLSLPFLAIYTGIVTFLKLAAAYAFGIEALEKAVPNVYGNARTADLNDYVLAGLFGENATVQAMNDRRLNKNATGQPMNARQLKRIT